MPQSSQSMEILFGTELSEPGTNRRNIENKVYAWWLEVLQDIEGMSAVVQVGDGVVFLYAESSTVVSYTDTITQPVLVTAQCSYTYLPGILLLTEYFTSYNDCMS